MGMGVNIPSNKVLAFVRRFDEVQSLIWVAMSQLNLSARAYHRILKLARTIADLAGSDDIHNPSIWVRHYNIA
jgi:magnesium chelatase family protein